VRAERSKPIVVGRPARAVRAAVAVLAIALSGLAGVAAARAQSSSGPAPAWHASATNRCIVQLVLLGAAGEALAPAMTARVLAGIGQALAEGARPRSSRDPWRDDVDLLGWEVKLDEPAPAPASRLDVTRASAAFAARLAAEVLDTAPRGSVPREAWSETAKALALAGEAEAAVRAAERVEDAIWRRNALRDVVEALADAGDFAAAGRLQARLAAPADDGGLDVTWGAGHIVERHLERGDLDAAMAVARALPRPLVRAEQVLVVARRHVVAGNPEAARRAAALVALAIGQAGADDREAGFTRGVARGAQAALQYATGDAAAGRAALEAARGDGELDEAHVRFAEDAVEMAARLYARGDRDAARRLVGAVRAEVVPAGGPLPRAERFSILSSKAPLLLVQLVGLLDGPAAAEAYAAGAEDDARADVHGSLAVLWAMRGDVETARRQLDHIAPDAWQRDRVIEHAAGERLAAGDAAGAVALAGVESDPERRRRLHAALAGRAGALGVTDAVDTLLAALPDAADRDEVRRAWVTQAAQAGHWDAALALARGVEAMPARAEALASLAREALAVLLPDRARPALEEALAVPVAAEALAQRRAEVLADLGRAAALAGDPDRARAAIEEAAAAARDVEPPAARAAALLRAAEGALDVGHDAAEVAALVAEAANAAEADDAAEPAVEALQGATELLFRKLGARPAASAMARRLLDAVWRIDREPDRRATAEYSAGPILAELGLGDDALAVVTASGGPSDPDRPPADDPRRAIGRAMEWGAISAAAGLLTRVSAAIAREGRADTPPAPVDAVTAIAEAEARGNHDLGALCSVPREPSPLAVAAAARGSAQAAAIEACAARPTPACVVALALPAGASDDDRAARARALGEALTRLVDRGRTAAGLDALGLIASRVPGESGEDDARPALYGADREDAGRLQEARLLARLGEVPRALAVAEGIGGAAPRARALMAIAVAVHRAGDAEAARDFLWLARELAGLANSELSRDLAVASAATGEAAAAMRTVLLISSYGSYKAELLVQPLIGVAGARIRAGEGAEALQGLDMLPAGTLRDQVLAGAARAFAASAEPADALRTAGQVTDPTARRAALAAVASMQLEAGALAAAEDSARASGDPALLRRVEARRVAVRAAAGDRSALDALERTGAPEDRAEGFGALAAALLRAGDLPGARAASTQAAAAARDISNPEIQAGVLAGAAELLARAADPPAARAAFADAVRAAMRVEGDAATSLWDARIEPLQALLAAGETVGAVR
jgi:hypothetical protein